MFQFLTPLLKPRNRQMCLFRSFSRKIKSRLIVVDCHSSHDHWILRNAESRYGGGSQIPKKMSVMLSPSSTNELIDYKFIPNCILVSKISGKVSKTERQVLRQLKNAGYDTGNRGSSRVAQSFGHCAETIPLIMIKILKAKRYRFAINFIAFIVN